MKIQGKTAAEIFDCVRALLQSGQLRPGQALPPVRDLAVELDINRNTVAAAYKRLSAAGIAVTQGRLGTIIREPSGPGEQEGGDHRHGVGPPAEPPRRLGLLPGARRLVRVGGALTAGASLELVTGNLDNDGKIHSGQDLKITANTLTNRAGGELIAVRNNELIIGGLLSNAGLIDGGYTLINAGNLLNTGRIYGDRIGIKTPLLQNEPNAVIASRGDMDLGVGTLTNREHALIYAAGDLRLGGTLDATGKAAGQAALLSNESATIEVERNADIAAASIQNRNLHFASESVEVGREAKWFYRLDGTTDIVDGIALPLRLIPTNRNLSTPRLLSASLSLTPWPMMRVLRTGRASTASPSTSTPTSAWVLQGTSSR